MSTRDVERDAARLVRVRGRWYRDASASASRARGVGIGGGVRERRVVDDTTREGEGFRRRGACVIRFFLCFLSLCVCFRERSALCVFSRSNGD